MFIFVFQCENNGDPFHDYGNGQYLTYWESVYWLLVTMSTVGFGEISPATDLGRAFIVVFIMGSFVSKRIYVILKHVLTSRKKMY